MRVPDETLGAWRAFLNAHALATRRINRDLAEAGLPDLSWYDVLWALHEATGRGLRVNELARAVVLSPTGMSRFVDRLERQGLVRREPDPADRRALQVVLTEAGRDLLRRMWPIYARGIETYFAEHLPSSPAALRTTFDAMATMESSGSRSPSPSSSPS
jgi:DNA-binding MarR family transcriptional regulator